MCITSLCSNLTGTVRAEIDCKNVVAEACDVVQLSQVALQRAAGKTGFVKWSHKTINEGVQTGRPTDTNACSVLLLMNV